jgi:hypothetical protein
MTLVSAPRSSPKSTTRVAPLILYLSVNLTEIQRDEKGYCWPRPRQCLRCKGNRIWGHGYVGRFFDGVADALWMKRWRCPDCRTVYTMRPSTHWRGFWADRETILSSLRAKEYESRWLEHLCRERQQYWWQGFTIQRRFEGPAMSLASLFNHHIIAATHSLTHREIQPISEVPYRIFAFTPPLRGP